MSLDQSLIFEIPSKTFIIGEYLAIGGTASMLLNTEPSFVVKITSDTRYGYHPDSPAGALRKNLGQTSVGYNFIDPHQGLGGFGRSTAEYLSVYLYDLYMNRGISEFSQPILGNLEDFILQYKQSSGGEYSPSGADLVAQVMGGLCWYDGMNFSAEKLAWPFPGYNIFVFHTGKKLATHEHLKDLRAKNFRELIPLLVASRTSLSQKNLKVFCQSLDLYYDALNDMGLSDRNIRERVMNLRKNPEILAAKGCGAMGIDTVLVIGESSNLDRIQQLCQNEDFQYITSLSQAHPGAILTRSI